MLPIDKHLEPKENPIDLFCQWFYEAEKKEPNNPNAACLATVGPDGMPSARIVLVKTIEPEGLVFFTNINSRKGQQLTNHPKAALCFYWKSLQRQVRFEGHTEIVSSQEADDYFVSRPRGSQIGAWASQQSQILSDRQILIDKTQELEDFYQDKIVPRPPHWLGFRLRPILVEFWEERLFRLHERLQYRLVDGQWITERLYP